MHNIISVSRLTSETECQYVDAILQFDAAYCGYLFNRTWQPMHMQPMYRMNGFITVDGNGRARTNAYIAGGVEDVGADIFDRGLCLPSDNKMTVEQQEKVIEVVRACFE